MRCGRFVELSASIGPGPANLGLGHQLVQDLTLDLLRSLPVSSGFLLRLFPARRQFNPTWKISPYPESWIWGGLAANAMRCPEQQWEVRRGELMNVRDGRALEPP